MDTPTPTLPLPPLPMAMAPAAATLRASMLPTARAKTVTAPVGSPSLPSALSSTKASAVRAIRFVDSAPAPAAAIPILPPETATDAAVDVATIELASRASTLTLSAVTFARRTAADTADVIVLSASDTPTDTPSADPPADALSVAATDVTTIERLSEAATVSEPPAEMTLRPLV